jgi:hypothetical protein
MPEEDDNPKRTQALAELLWDYLKNAEGYRNLRKQTGFGTKTKIGLRRSIERIIEETK